jgi:hypothetical protein
MTPQVLEPQPATVDDHIKSIVDRAPELTPEQRDKLAVILRTGRTPDDREAA